MLYLIINRSLLTRSSLLDHPCYVRWAWLSLIDAAQADDGAVYGVTPSQLAKMAHISPVEAEEALRIFLAPDSDSASAAESGRRLIPIDGVPNGYTLTTWDDHSDLLTRAQAAARQRRSRRERKAIPPAKTTEQPPKQQNEKQLSEQQEKVKRVIDGLEAAGIKIQPSRAASWLKTYGVERVGKMLGKLERGHWHGKSASYLQSILESSDDLSLDPVAPPPRPRAKQPFAGLDLSEVE